MRSARLAACYGGEYDESKSIRDRQFLSIFFGFDLCTGSCAGDRQRRADRSTITPVRKSPCPLSAKSGHSPPVPRRQPQVAAYFISSPPSEAATEAGCWASDPSATSITTDAARHRCLIVAAGLVVFVPTRGRFRVNTTALIVIRMAITGHMAGINTDLLLRRGGSRPTSPSCRGYSELIVTFATLKMRPPPLAPCLIQDRKARTCGCSSRFVADCAKQHFDCHHQL